MKNLNSHILYKSAFKSIESYVHTESIHSDIQRIQGEKYWFPSQIPEWPHLAPFDVEE